MAQCEANYWLLQKLMPASEVRDSWEFAVERAKGRWEVRIQITERMRYTTTVQVFRQDADDSEWLRAPRLTVRLYHDAHLAEVLACEEHRRLNVKYSYPNHKMYQADEKAQFNRFLGEWLRHCLANGHSLHEISLPVR
ncbi:DUF1249 domain-containing protein [Gilvimarinus agarilyticus]|uniref:DUF1249 domain-containing protein n=1 Tax=Gilvimarinus sp. 2_MG-2023 TaxID=3062666 RepID=UPI001C09D174|nr:DUF1249 domain-containing protein [Gilvimarinus sp. 2_MG-2023]MBU2887654.1 DUF1249 domain-containing protein [Gilvimarinus agarilyticus]MDO6572303.1 DUF1249 domain-containing protein [Gilvimarinus sp. 2_MG-2023]